MRGNSWPKCRRKNAQHASVVVWVLICSSVIILAILTYFVFGLSSEKNATFDRRSAETDLYLDAAVAEAMTKLNEGLSAEDTTAPRKAHVTASPGLLEILRYDYPPNRGTHAKAAAFDEKNKSALTHPFEEKYQNNPANPRWIPLFSYQHRAPQLRYLSVSKEKPLQENPYYNPEASFNINTKRNPFTPGRSLLSGQSGPTAARISVRKDDGTWNDSPDQISEGVSSAERAVWVQWIPIHEEPFAAKGPKNRLLGRYAYWVDCDNTKLRLDRPLRTLREHPSFVMTLGESDAAMSKNGSSMVQGSNHEHRLARSRAQTSIPYPLTTQNQVSLANSKLSHPKNTRYDWSGRPSNGFSPLAAHYSYQTWLDWSDPNSSVSPIAAGAPVIDWDFFSALKPAHLPRLAYDDVWGKWSRHWVKQPDQAPSQLSTALDQVTRTELSDAADDEIKAAWQSFLTASATFSGYDESLDPLGYPKINIAQWQRHVTQNGKSVVSIERIKSSDLWARLSDPNYYRALYPGAWPRKGKAASFIEGLNSFLQQSGFGNGNNLGEHAALQMLVNLAEAAQPPTVPPLIDSERGIVGARSMPYVAEVCTRARSALWELPESVRHKWFKLASENNPDLLKETHEYPPGSNHQKNFTWWASHVCIDLCFGLMNTNPFDSSRFDGVLEVNGQWQSPYSGLAQFPLQADFSGYYAPSPSPGKNARHVRMNAPTVAFKLGIVPGAWMDQMNTALQIDGWNIYRRSPQKAAMQLWHQVPVRHPGAQAVRPWWQMSAINYNSGEREDKNSLRAYCNHDSNFTDISARPVGWFTPLSDRRMRPHSLFVPSSVTDTIKNNKGLPWPQEMKHWAEAAPLSARLDIVFCKDPVLGHRTGINDISTGSRAGHFHGALGHGWRRHPISDDERSHTFGYVPPLPGQTMFETKVVSLVENEYQPGPPTTLSTRSWKAQKHTLYQDQHTLNLPSFTIIPKRTVAGSYATHNNIYPTGSNQTLPAEAPDSLCGMFISPALSGPLPQGDFIIDNVNGSSSSGPSSTSGASPPPAASKASNPNNTSGSSNTSKPSNSGASASNSTTQLNRSLDVDFEPPHSITPPQGGSYSIDKKKGPRSLFAHAPPGRPFVSVGEIGFVHSGFPNCPIMIGPDEGRSPWQLNSPLHGPPMRLLLDLFSAPSLTSGQSQDLTRAEFLRGDLDSPSDQRAAWNVNTTIAHDHYLALRAGGDRISEKALKDHSLSDDSASLHATWIPGASGFNRREAGSEAFHGRSLEDHWKKKSGYPLSRHLSPFPHLARPWDMWLHFIAGDVSDCRSTAGELWGYGSAMTRYFGPGTFTWQPGKGGGPAKQPWVDFDPSISSQGKLLTFGTDGRNNNNNQNDNTLRGRFAADQHLDILDYPPNSYFPLSQATRFSLFPMRHFISDLALSYQVTAEFSDLRTALNPTLHPAIHLGATVGTAPAPIQSMSDKNSKSFEQSGFPGFAANSGVFYHAPMALLTSHASTAANAFTIYAIAQTISDIGQPDPQRILSGPGHFDPDDRVMNEKWLRLSVERIPGSNPVRWKIIEQKILAQ